MTEIFKDIPGYKGLYEISNTGRLKSLAHVDQSGHKRQEKMISPAVGSSGYLTARLHNSKQKTYNIHQLVAMAFLGHKPCGHKLVVDHIDFNKLNNELNNLRIISARENSSLMHLKSASKYVGVTWHKRIKKWQAAITTKKKKKHLGYFSNELKASLAYYIELEKIGSVTINRPEE